VKGFASTCPATTVKQPDTPGLWDWRTGNSSPQPKAKFDLLLTVDRGFEYQQNLEHRKIAVIIFCGESVLLEDLVPLMPACLAHLESIRPGPIVRISGD